VTGPSRFEARLPEPASPFQDVAVLVFPAPRGEGDLLSARKPGVTTAPATAGAERLVDGDLMAGVAFPAGAGRGAAFDIDLAVESPFTARSLELVPADRPWAANVELLAADAAGAFHSVRTFRFDRSNYGTGVGFLPRGAVAMSFPAVTSRLFRLRFTGVGGNGAGLAEIALSGAARVESYVEKQLGKMHPTPLPMWDTYLWPARPEPESSDLALAPESVVNLTDRLRPDGTLAWDAPAGEWIILRTGMTPTGVQNAPASPEGRGLEVDKMNRAAAQRHFDAFVGEVLRRMPPADRKALKHVVADSYETGSQNWTDGLAEDFRKVYGYDPRPWLPALTGRVVGGADRTDRFLWDLRRLVADRVSHGYVAGLRDACRDHGLELWLENYGHWGFPGEFLQYGGQSHRIGGEFWVTGDLGSIECRAASSCANTYGRPFVSAESFTGGPAFRNSPGSLKARGDWSFCEGVNHAVLHVYIHQPWEDRVPGVNAPWGTEFNRHNTWFARGREWVDYERRCCWMLQQGWRVADVAYFIGEDAPKMTGVRQPELPPGHDFDYLNAEVLVRDLAVRDGQLVLPHGVRYRVLVLPGQETMRPETLRKVRDLVQAGATVVGRPPARSPSLAGYPDRDHEVRALAREVWGEAAGTGEGEHALGRGRVVWGKPLRGILDGLQAPADFDSPTRLRYTHRRSGDTDIYFVANPNPRAVTTLASFRAGPREPELWWPDSGRRARAAVYDVDGGLVRMPIQLGPQGSVFVVFREPAAPPARRVVAVRQAGADLLTVGSTRAGAAGAGASEQGVNDFTFAGWIRPEADTTLVVEANRGIHGMAERRNEVIPPPHGNDFGGPDHAGFGLAVGRNGVCVFEHGAEYFSPTLVHAASLADWTHVAVVYRGGRPSLYLNGKPARTGLQSLHTVHSGTIAAPAGAFRGRVGDLAVIGRALDDAAVAKLAESTPRPGGDLAGPLEVTRDNSGKLIAVLPSAGSYVFRFADGADKTVTVAGTPAQTVAGPWEVSFASGWGAPERVNFDALVSWTDRPEEGIRFFSGTAVYRKTVDIPVGWGKGQQVMLDLGEVRDLAVVRVNGVEIGTRWLAPWQWDIGAALKPGSNLLEVEVVNPWNNRLVGDAALAAGQRKTTILLGTVNKNTPLIPAGLLGPVTIRTLPRVTVP
jgi:hypothetical protein